MLAPPVKSGPRFDSLIQSDKVRVIDENGVVTLPLYNVKATGHVSSLRKRLGIDE